MVALTTTAGPTQRKKRLKHAYVYTPTENDYSRFSRQTKHSILSKCIPENEDTGGTVKWLFLELHGFGGGGKPAMFSDFCGTISDAS